MGSHGGSPQGWSGDHDGGARDRRVSSQANTGGSGFSPRAYSSGNARDSGDDQPKDGARWLCHGVGWLKKGMPVQDDTP